MNALLEAQPGLIVSKTAMDAIARSIFPVTFAPQINWINGNRDRPDGLAGSRSTSSRFAFNGLDRSYRIVDSVGITALPPKLQLCPVINVS